jgi:hypothetical protein
MYVMNEEEVKEVSGGDKDTGALSLITAAIAACSWAANNIDAVGMSSYYVM